MFKHIWYVILALATLGFIAVVVVVGFAQPKSAVYVEAVMDLIAPRVKNGSIDKDDAREQLHSIAVQCGLTVFRDMKKPIEDALDGKISINMPVPLKERRRREHAKQAPQLRSLHQTAEVIDLAARRAQPDEADPVPSRRRLETEIASSYEMRALEWVWLNRFALGKLGLIAGLPDRGKGLIASNIIGP